MLGYGVRCCILDLQGAFLEANYGPDMKSILQLYTATSLLFSGLCWTSLSGQFQNDLSKFDPQFERFELPLGVEGNKVLKMVEDSVGFLWFASHAGLIRYDGQRFVHYRHDSINENSPANNLLEYLYLDSKGLMWLGHYGAGVTSFDPVLERFTRYDLDAGHRNLSESNIPVVHSIVEDRQEFVWIGTNHGLYRFDRKSKEFRLFSHNESDPGSLSHNVVKALYVDRQGTLWVGTGFYWSENQENRKKKPGGLNRYRPETESFERFIHDPADSSSLRDHRIATIFEDADATFWVGTQADGLHQMDRTEGTFKHFPHNPGNPSQLSQPYRRNVPVADQTNNNFVTFIGQDHKSRIWIGAWTAGLNVYDPVMRKMKHFENDPEILTGLSTNNIWDFFQSRDGTIFFYTGGMRKVFKLNEEANKIPFHDLRPLLNNRTIRFTSIVEDLSGNVWLGTEGLGLICFNPKTNTVKLFKYDPDDPNNLSSNNVTSIRPDRDGLIWISTTDGLNCHDPVTGKFRRYQNDPLVPGSLKYFAGIASLRPVFQDSNGNIWVLTYSGGLNLLDGQTGLFKNFKWEPDNPSSIGANTLSGICEDKYGYLWIGAANLLDRFDPKTELFEHFEIPGEMGGVWDVESDEAGRIWFIAETGELGRLDPGSGRITKFTRTNSQIPAARVRSLIKNSDGRIWMDAPNALLVLDPRTEGFQLHPCPTDLFSSPEPSHSGLNDRSMFANSEGTLFFAGNGGYYTFQPAESSVGKDPTLSQVLISELILDDKRIIPGGGSILEEPIWSTKAISLSHRQNSFSFGITCMDYRDPTAIQFRYRLLNHESNWRSDVQEGLVTYRNLPPGKYVFELQGANSAGVWSKKEVSLRVKINPPWWATWWAMLLFAIVLLSVLYYVRYLELSKQRRKLEEQQRINAVTSKFVPTAFLTSLGKNNIMDVTLGDSVEQEVTVMFSDIRDYTTLSETMTPQENFRFVNAFNQRMGPIIQSHNGFVNQYLGDAIMALFKDSAENSLLAAIQMQEQLTDYNRQRTVEGLVPIQMGIGLHTGPLIMGIIGDDKRMDAATISDAVNTASRIEGLTKHFKVNILLSEACLQQIHSKDEFHFRCLGEVQLKGKKEPIGIYECMDGDLPHIREKKIGTDSLFDDGLNKYLSRQFSQASSAFKEVIEINPADLTARFFYERSIICQQNGVAADWTGVEIMSFK